MTLLNAPAFDVQKETRNRNLMIGSLVLIVVLAVLAVAGFLMGHGWLFINLQAEHRVDQLLSAVQDKDYAKAYGIFYNDSAWQQHSDKYKDYPLQRFTEDFTTESDWKGPIVSHHVDFSKRDHTGVVVASTINGASNLTLKVQSTDGSISFFPFTLTRGF